MTAKQETTIAAAEAVVRKMREDVALWHSYGGPRLPSEREAEMKLAGAEMVLVAIKEAARG